MDSELDSVVGSALFLKLFPKTGKKWILFKARKTIQVSGHIHFKNILFFRVSPWYLNLKVFKVVSRIYSELRHIQDPRHIKNAVNIPCEHLAY